MNPSSAYKSVYITAYRWNVKNFGQGGLPKFNSLFGVSFLMILLLTNLLMVTQLSLRWFNAGIAFGIIILLAATGFLLLNYFILLNNGRFKKWNIAFEKLSRHNKNSWSVMLMACVILSCVFMIFMGTT